MKRILLTMMMILGCSPITTLAIDQGSQAPELSLPTISGETVSLHQLKGKVIYLDFWASWCGPCKHTLPWMQSLQNRFGSRGLQVVAVNLDKDTSSAAAALEELHPTFTVGLDPDKSAVSKYSPPKMPTSFLIDRNGDVALIHAGFKEGDQLEIEGKIEELLSK